MLSMKKILDMVCTDAIDGASIPDAYHDDRHLNIPYPTSIIQEKSKSDLPPIPFSLRLIESPDGVLDWIE